jgi:DNA-directed RNA polymerase specialized sigma subunit
MENQNVQDIANKKKSLKRYKKNLNCINRLEDKLLSLDERITSVRSPNYSGMPRSSVRVTVDDLISDKVDLEQRIARLKKKGNNLKREILDEIDTIDDPRYCSILESFFIDCMTMSEIAEVEGYTERHIYRLYNEAISILAEKRQ